MKLPPSPSPSRPFPGLRLLLLEDNYLVGMSMKRMLERLGCHVVGPFAAIADAEHALDRQTVDGGVLDINVIGGTSAPIAESLRDRGSPFFFVTGYQSPAHLPPELATARRLHKPIDERILQRTIAELFLS